MQAAQRLTPEQPDTEGQVALRALLASLASEAADLAESADQLQLLFGQLLGDPPTRPGDAVERAQTLDGLVQRLHGMNAFLSDLSSRALHDLTAEATHAASNLRLTSQGRRFSPEGVRAEPLAGGDCDLF